LQTAALYIRVSTEEQTEYSPEAQKKALLDYAKKNKLFTHKDYIFIDEGKSGKMAEKRPDFMKMIGLAKSKEKPFGIILVHKFDRFARNREDSVVYKSMLRRECGVKVISITESLDGDDKMSVLIEAILEAMAEFYSINLAEEVKKGMTEKARQGGFQTSPPLGYRLNENSKTLEIVEEEAQHVRYIFNQFVEYDKGKSYITRHLANIGVKSKRGNPIDFRNIDYILQNPVYMGKVRWTPIKKVRRNFNHPDTIIVDGLHEPIISIELFQRAAEKIAATKRVSKPKQRPIEECRHWLSGLLKCSNCGASLTLSGVRNPSPSFQCRGYGSAICNISHSISIKKAECAVRDELGIALSYCDGSEFELSIARIDTTQEEIDALNKQLSLLPGRLLRAKEAYLAEIDSLGEYKKNKTRIEQQQTEIENKLKKLINNQPTVNESSFIGKVHNVLDILNSKCEMKAKQNAVRSIIDKIVYDKPNSSIEVYYRDM